MVWAVAGMLAAPPVARAEDPTGLLVEAWAVAEQRGDITVAWMDDTYGGSGKFSRFPTIGNPDTGRWLVASNTRDWRDGFWPGTLWFLAQRTGDSAWEELAEGWSQPLATTTNTDHDIGFVVLCSLGKGWHFHDDSSDPGGIYREFARDALTVAAAKLDTRFNKPNSGGAPVPAGFIRSWDNFQDPYPVCIDNLMNLELLLATYELNGRLPAQRPWFDHALTHARTSIARHLRADAGTYHVVRHFEDGVEIGGIERKSTLQGYGDETTWSRGQAWAIYGLTAVYRHASRDPGTDASDVLAAARACADHFLDHLPNYFTDDPYNHRAGDFVPPSDFDAALGEPVGPWNDANDDYNPSTGSGLGDREPATHEFTPRDSSAAAVAASGLLELAGFVPSAADRDRYLAAARDILTCLVAYDGGDSGTAPDYLCAPDEQDHPGILKLGSQRWGDENRSLSYGDYYFLEALARYEAMHERDLLEATQQVRRDGAGISFEFERGDPAPAMAFRVLRSPDLTNWATVAAKTGAGPWTGVAVVTEQAPADGRVKVRVADPGAGDRGFYRILTRSLGDTF